MHPEDAGADRLDNTTDDDDEAAASSSLWWALHRPESYALAAMALALAAVLGVLPGFEISQAFEVADNFDLRGPLAVAAGVRLGVAAIAAALAVMSIRNEDEDVTWSAAVARASLLVAAVGAAFALATFIGVLTHDGDPQRIAG